MRQERRMRRACLSIVPSLTHRCIPVVRSQLDCMVDPKAWSDMPLGTPLVEALDQLDRFAKEVMPGFRGAKVAAAAE